MPLYQDLIRHSGNQDLFRAVEMSLSALAHGHAFHLHAEGLRGTGKTTIMRAAKSILPPIIRIKNCLYNCEPANPHCPDHKDLTREQIEALGSETVPCPFLEISQAAKIGTVVGTIDLVRLTDNHTPAASLLPGTLVQAHRGIVFIDEINRLADTSPELADVLLDVMGTKPGRIQIEETGLPPVELPLTVAVWAASNPDEDPGALSQVRRQLSDRFDLTVAMGRPNDYQAVSAILSGHTASRQVTEQVSLPRNISSLEQIRIDPNIRNILASIYVDFNLESLRAIQAMEMAATLQALHSGKDAVTIDDVISIAPMALTHRTDHATMTSILKYLHSLTASLMELDSQPVVAQTAPTRPLPERLENESRSSWFNHWWQNIKRRLSKTVPNPAINPQVSQSPNYSQGSSGGQQQAANTTDPMQTVVQSPPSKAIPLSELPVDKFLHTGEEKHG